MTLQSGYYWNHRVIKKRIKRLARPGFDTVYGIHEVHYDDGIPGSLTMEPISVCTCDIRSHKEGIKALRWTLLKMLMALKRPVLDYDNDFKPKKKNGNKRR